ncbi:MAG: hypothetical protein AB1414_08395 [bacterium]
MSKRSLKGLIGSLIVFGLVVGLYVSVNGMGGEPGGARSKEQGARKTERLKPKIQRQVGTPTVQQLLDKVESNYHKIQDLKANWNFKTWDSEFAKWLGIVGDLITQDEKFFFKAPDKLKWIPPNELFTLVKKNNIEYRRMGDGWAVEATQDTPVRPTNLPWYTLLDPDRFDFYWRLDEIITKFDSRVIDNPEPDIWVIEAVPKASNPEDDYNYPNPNGKLWLYVNYGKGVITQIEGYSIPENDLLTFRAEIKDFELTNNTWIPTKFAHTQFRTNVKEEITLSNIQLNTGTPDSEFEF